VHETLNLIDKHPDKAEALKGKLTDWASDMKYKGLEMENSPEMRKCYDFYFDEV
jgi:hypothetical protein